MDSTYIFISERLGFRNWKESDIEPLFKINSDPKVMEFFPSTQTLNQTKNFIKRMQDQYSSKGFCYFAVDTLHDNSFIGFIGISEQNFEADFTPCIDIGWRLSQNQWGKGYATEGAKRCLEFAFNTLNLESIKAICPSVNQKSERVMNKLGMTREYAFNHPLLKDHKTLEECILYEVTRN
ncbi:MAG: GNAT family N-acetyltransferase [Flavobacteriaceae bacterium]